MEGLLQHKYMKRFCILILIIVWAISLFGNNTITGDSVGVKLVEGKSFILYKVSAGETAYAVSRKYGIAFAELSVSNPHTDLETIKMGQEILVPEKFSTENISYQNFQNETTAPSEISELDFYHTVLRGETVYAISKKYNVELSALLNVNPLIGTDYTVKEGQLIKILTPRKQELLSIETKNVSVEKENVEQDIVLEGPILIAEPNNTETIKIKTYELEQSAGNQDTKADTLARDINSTLLVESLTSATKTFAQLYADYAYLDMSIVSEKGAATWIEGANQNPISTDNFYALHNNAPIGSIIKVRNMMNNRIIYAKVIGTLTESEVNEKVVIKLSSGASETLNVLDKRFASEITYYELPTR